MLSVAVVTSYLVMVTGYRRTVALFLFKIHHGNQLPTSGNWLPQDSSYPCSNHWYGNRLLYLGNRLSCDNSEKFCSFHVTTLHVSTPKNHNFYIKIHLFNRLIIHQHLSTNPNQFISFNHIKTHQNHQNSINGNKPQKQPNMEKSKHTIIQPKFYHTPSLGKPL